MFWNFLAEKCFFSISILHWERKKISYLGVMRLSYLEHDLKRKKSRSEARKYVDHSVVIHTSTHTHTHIHIRSFNTYTGHLRKISCIFYFLLYRDQSSLGKNIGVHRNEKANKQSQIKLISSARFQNTWSKNWQM